VRRWCGSARNSKSSQARVGAWKFKVARSLATSRSIDCLILMLDAASIGICRMSGWSNTWLPISECLEQSTGTTTNVASASLKSMPNNRLWTLTKFTRELEILKVGNLIDTNLAQLLCLIIWAMVVAIPNRRSADSAAEPVPGSCGIRILWEFDCLSGGICVC
jgi:hypothetical protein